MRYISKTLTAIGIVAAIAVTASAADARSHRAYDGAYDSIGGTSARSSVPYDAGGVAYAPGQRGQDDSSDFQLQGR